MVADELEFTETLSASVAEVRLAARAGHVIAAGTPLNVELQNIIHSVCETRL